MGNNAQDRRRPLHVADPVGRQVVSVLVSIPALTLLVCTGTVAWFCHGVLHEATQGDVTLPSLAPLVASVIALFATGSLLVVLHGVRWRQRLMGPSRRIERGLRRMRQGDVSFRIRVRQGDPLEGVATEVNRLLDWLNTNPPPDVRLGGDVVDLDERVEQDGIADETGPIGRQDMSESAR